MLQLELQDLSALGADVAALGSRGRIRCRARARLAIDAAFGARRGWLTLAEKAERSILTVALSDWS